MPVDEQYIIRFEFDKVRDNLKDIESNIENSVANATASRQSGSSGMGMIGIGFGRFGRIRLPQIRLNVPRTGMRSMGGVNSARMARMENIASTNNRTLNPIPVTSANSRYLSPGNQRIRSGSNLNERISLGPQIQPQRNRINSGNQGPQTNANIIKPPITGAGTVSASRADRIRMLQEKQNELMRRLENSNKRISELQTNLENIPGQIRNVAEDVTIIKADMRNANRAKGPR
jgi:hypothetical protein